MRFVDRTQFSPPEFTQSPEWDELRRVLTDIHDASRGGKRGTQTVAGFEELFSQFRGQAVEALFQVFAGKCAYTEQPEYSEAGLMFHLHRPGSDALGLDGSPAPEHYWWLQTEWTNWMLVSQQIMSIKGTNFPVVGERLEFGGQQEEVPLLIDPCSEQPAFWLNFDEKGGVSSRQIESAVFKDRYPGFDRGEFNIRALDLNWSNLMDGRRYAISEATPEKFKYVLEASVEDVQRWLDRALDPGRPFLGAIRQQLARAFIEELESLSVSMHTEQVLLTTRLLTHEIAAELCAAPGRVTQLRQRITQQRFEYLLEAVIKAALETCPDLESLFLEPAPAAAIPDEESEEPRAADEGEAEPEPPPSPEPATKKTKLRGHRPTAKVEPDPTIDRQARLRQIRIRNFKAIEDLTIDVPDGVETIRVGPLHDRRERTSAVNWKMLLGENACGKSSILQAIALALFGPELEDEPPLPLEKLRRRGIGNKQSFVELRFRGYERPLRLRLNRRSFRYNWKPEFKLFIRAYGATRLFQSDPEHYDANRATERRRVGNLFDPLFPVIDVNTWLMGLDEGDFNVAARAIRNLIAGVGDQKEASQAHADLIRDPTLGEVTLGGDTLDELSDGYRALLALTCDIMAGLGSGLSDMENAVGIVLIDEIGAHLHPRLRMQIVARLRYIFPQIQFVCSTHEPLCLRGLFDREVDRIRRVDGTVGRETIDRNPSSFRIDQLLTSEFFGLESTIDPEIDGEFQLYYHLLSRDDLSDEDVEQRDRLRNRLITEGVLGYTRRDQMVYEAIDSYLAERSTRPVGPEEQEAKLKQATIDRVKDIWSLAELRRARQ